ncbi:hypothetical protein QCA50_011104 [Cerrena zonata]|uniref:Fungal lipase-type domain-containing protein n=1 Tax=Cerrena zonata TaxID=2478898 RepID=A0AAW0G6Y1_9APHY
MPSGRYLLFQALCALFVGTQALPAHVLESRQSVSVLSPDQVAPFLPYAFYSSSASCEPALTLNWTCGKKCDANPTFQPVASGGDGAVVQYWYVGYDPVLKTVIVSHQGTEAEKILPVLTDIDIIQQRLDTTLFPGISSSILAHAGFAGAQARAANDVLAAVRVALTNFSATSVTLTGHSLGAAISLIDSVFLPLHLPKSTTFKTVLYGLPRVGNQAFADYVDANVTSVTHVHNKKDFVPTLPGRFLGFHHPSGEIHITTDDSWVSCPGQDSNATECTISYVPNLFVGDINDHPGPYDGVLMGCNK